MIHRIINFSVKNKLITSVFLFVFISYGIYSVTQLSIDALPDVTNNQVQVITVSPNLATQEVEQFITYPLELHFKNLPDLVELRSTSRSGLSVITIVFKDQVPIHIARQWVSERLKTAAEEIPKSYGTPELIPPTTGLGEIFQYTLAVDSAFRSKYNEMDLRTIQDWIVKRQVLGVSGVVDVSSFGGRLKQYEIAVDPQKLSSMNISILQVYDALKENNENTGASYIEKGPNIYFIRGEGLINTLQDIQNTIITKKNGMPVLVKDIAQVKFGYAPRYGAMTRNGQGETVGGVVLMAKGENSVRVIKDVKERMKQVVKSLPEGVHLDFFVDRSKLISSTIETVEHNLLMGAMIVIFILVLMLGNLRAGLIVASVIPLSMLFAIILMNAFGISANLMSMGALDFGLIVDGAVIIVESMMFLLHDKFKNKTLNQNQMDHEVIYSSSKIMNSAIFGQFIILIVYIPIFALVGIEGKMFRPMALTVSFAIIGALLLTLTYVPLMSSVFLSKNIESKEDISERFIHWIQKFYSPSLTFFLKYRSAVLICSVLLLLLSFYQFKLLGGEFIPELDEGDFATNYTIRQGSSLTQTIEVGTQLEKILLNNFTEVKEVVSKIGTSEIPTDPMPIESADLIIILKEKKDWKNAVTKEELAEKMNEKLSVIPGVNLSFEQPIQMRFNELIAGVKSDIAIKVFGDNLELLTSKGNEIAQLIKNINGATDIKVEQVVGMPQLIVKWNRNRIAQFGLTISDANKILNTALAGGKAGLVYEGEKMFDLVVRYADYHDADMTKVKNIRIPLDDGTQIPISQLADVSFKSAPAQISRDDGERRIVIEVNARNRDIQSVAQDIEAVLNSKLKLPAGYYIEYGGTFQNLQEAKGRLSLAVPAALVLIFLLLFFTFRSIRESLIIFSAIPMAAIGGVFALYIRGMNFSISAGIGFIALFGVAVLNGIVLIAYFNRLEQEGEKDVMQRILKGTAARLRPVLATAAVASLGFLPMALSTSAGSEIQKPLATVVIGGLITSTLLTLILLPVLYSLLSRNKKLSVKGAALSLLLPIILSLNPNYICAQSPSSPHETKLDTLTLDSCIAYALLNHPMLHSANYAVQGQYQLKKSIVALDPLSIQLQKGNINSDKNDYYLSFSTGMQNPYTLAKQIELQNTKIKLANSSVAITKIELIKNITTVYYQLKYFDQQLKLIEEQEAIFSEMANFAQKKYALGESGLLEKLNAEAQFKKLVLAKNSLQSEIKNAYSELQKWTGMKTQIIISSSDPIKIELPLEIKNISLEANPYYNLQKNHLEMSKAEWKLEKSKWNPSIQLGGFNQSIDNKSPFWGWSIGTSIPILKTGQSAKVNAAYLQTKKEEEDWETFKINLNAMYKISNEEYLKSKDQLEYYETDGLHLASTIIQAAKTSYKTGEIGYTEFIQSMSEAYNIRSAYLQTLQHFNQSTIELKYITN